MPSKVAVNLSPLQFRTGNLLQAVIEALENSGLPPDRLELEITETLLLERSEQVLATLHALRALGVRISMDDFGTGYSSLSYLRSFPFDKIKIDRSFVRDLGANADSQAIVRAIISLGSSLGITHHRRRRRERDRPRLPEGGRLQRGPGLPVQQGAEAEGRPADASGGAPATGGLSAWPSTEGSQALRAITRRQVAGPFRDTTP